MQRDVLWLEDDEQIRTNKMLYRPGVPKGHGPFIHAIDPWAPSAGRMRQLLSPRDRARLARVASVVRFKKGETVYRQGEAATAVFNLIGGGVKACLMGPDGAEHISAFLFAGDLFGLAQEGRYVSTIKALSPVTAYRLAVPALRARLANDHALEFHFVAKLLHELRQMQRHALLLASNRVVEKLAMILNMLARQQAAKGESASRIHLPMTRSDIADYAGVTLPAISRAFRSLAVRGIAEIRARRHVVILDRSAFAKLAGASTYDR